MAGNELKKVVRGESFRMPASAYNAFVDAASAHKATQLTQAALDSPFDTKTGIVTVRNITGADQDIFACLELDEVLVPPADNLQEFQFRFAFDAKEPGPDAEKLAILQEPIKAGALGKALVSGISPVRLDVTDEDHTTAGFVENETGFLESGRDGARILWKEDGTSQKWGIVQFPFGNGRVFTITEGTYLQEGLDVDLSASATLSGRTALDSEQLSNQRIVLKFPRRISIFGKLGIVCDIKGKVRVWGWDFVTSEASQLRGLLNARPILDWNGLTPSTLRWSNQNDLNLHPDIGVVEGAWASALIESDAEEAFNNCRFAAGDANLDGGPTVNIALIFDVGPVPIPMEGILFETLLFFNNTFLLPGGNIFTEFRLNRLWGIRAVYGF